MKKYIFAFILGCGAFLCGQAVYAQTDYDISDNTFITETVDKNILADEDLMKTITPEQLERYIDQGANVNIRFIRETKDAQDESKIIETKNVTPLMMAALGNPDKKVIEILLENGADIKAQNEDEKTALMYAAQENSNPEVIKMLIGAGADVNTRTKVGWTALMLAARYNQNPEVIEVIKMLIGAGADVDSRDKDGWTALMLAARNNQNPEVIKMLIGAGADMNARGEKGATALMFAAGFNKNPEVIKMLIGAGADVNAKGEKGVTALMFAARLNQNPKVVETLLKHGADVNNYLDDPIITAAFVSMWNHNHKIFEMFFQDEIDKFCRINRTYSDDIYYCKDRLNNYMQKEHLLPSCFNDMQAMLALTPFLQALNYTDAGKGVYAIVILAEMTSKFNCSLSNTFKDFKHG
ncbi:MAG: ankyrin repeat domain-containing protein [Alphaproteobacteria bacterium]|nr:ankyrin repeat domain-containing protein [Alphaproteobacteria bacterium]